jgi:SulP family sulfate permease
MRRVAQRGYGRHDLQADLLAGLVVGIVSLPLSMALAIAVGAPPQHGLYTAIVAGLVIAPLGGSKFQVSGPTAAFVVILAPIVQDHGLGGLLTAGLMAGFVLVALGVMRLGNLIRYVPYPVTTGFTAGIAVVIATLQLKDAFGLSIAEMPDAWHEKILALWAARGTASPVEAGITVLTIVILVLLTGRSRSRRSAAGSRHLAAATRCRARCRSRRSRGATRSRSVSFASSCRRPSPSRCSGRSSPSCRRW